MTAALGAGWILVEEQLRQELRDDGNVTDSLG
jgi:hypothetical protein